ncbi:MAG: YraN family protein [Minisyncoccales bacterium]
MSTKEIGWQGEKIAENFLKEKGYRILDKNYSVYFGIGLPRAEIDLVAQEKETIVFVEVKTIWQKRTKESFAFFPGHKVNWQKQQKIIRAGQIWLTKNKIPLASPWRIDLIVVRINPGQETAEVQHFPNAVFR